MAQHTTTTSPAEKPDTYTIRCTCGEQVTYWGKAFAQVEAHRHEAWHQRVGR